MSELRRFKQVNVFSAMPLNGNPLAVVMDSDGLSDDQMLAIPWTNLSKTTFVLSPSEPQADFQVKIYSPAGELPFAGHPTLGTAHALLENDFKPKLSGHLVQQCGIGNVTIAIARDGVLAFEAPKATMTPLSAQRYGLLAAAAGGESSTGMPTIKGYAGGAALRQQLGQRGKIYGCSAKRRRRCWTPRPLISECPYPPPLAPPCPGGQCRF